MTAKIIVLTLSVTFVSFAFHDGPVLTATDIMKRVAVNQDKEQKARTEFVYEERVHHAMRRKDGKLLREEYRTFAVTPGVKGIEKKLQSVKGRLWKNGKYIPYEGEPVPEAGLFNIAFDGDGNGEGKTKDGIEEDLFPLTTEEQKKYAFELAGERVVHGRPAYRIRFRPVDRSDYGWTGEALVDQEEFQPVLVYTRLSRRLPFAVRTMLGTDVPGLGYNVQYTRIDKDLWFPSTYGTEFAVHALFLLNRTFSESVENKGFRRATVQSQIEFGASPETQ